MNAMLASDLPLPGIGRGKVRDIYAVGDDRVLLLTTDRISAFDVVMAETIPMKGAVLTQISAWWFKQLEGVVPHPLISADADAIIRQAPALRDHRAAIAGRAMLCRRTKVFPIECVIRGYLSGSAWKEYAAHGTLAGEKLAPGLVESAKLEPAIFSPATKAETGHDENITIARMRAILGDDVAQRLERMTRAIYALGEKISRDQGIVIADTKFEFGRDGDGRIILIDEVMTPDSSRFWAADAYRPGRPQPSFDKQPLRDYLDAERCAGRWNGEAPAPPLPASDADAEASVAVFTGTGGYFCAGADLKAVAAGDPNKKRELGGHDSIAPMGPSRLRLTKPVIAAVEGFAVAGGMELALWADMRVVAEDAIFGIYCRRFGVPLIDLGTIRLPRLIGHSQAMDLILTGRPVGGEEALRMGLANRLVAKGETRAQAIQLAKDIAHFPQTCMRADRLSALRHSDLEEA